MSRILSTEEVENLVRRDPLLSQLVRNVKMKYDDKRVYLMRQREGGILRILSITNSTYEECEELGRMFDPYYSFDGSCEDFPYPFDVSPYTDYLDKHSIDITDMV